MSKKTNKPSEERVLKLNIEDKTTLLAMQTCAQGFCKGADGRFCPFLPMKGSCAEIMATRALGLLEKITPGIAEVNK